MVFDRFEGLTLAANPLREYLGSSAIGIKSVQRSTRMTMKFTKGQETEAGMITALLGYSSIHTATGLSYLIRNSGFLHNVEQLKREGWDKLLWIDCGPLDDGTGRHLLTYLLGSETREIERVELQVLIDGAAHWHSVSHLFAGAEQLEQALVERFGIRLSQEPGIVELAQNRVDTKLTGQDSGVKSTVHSSKTGEMILYSASLSMFGAKVQIALIEKAIDYQLVMVPYDRDRGYEPKHPEVLRVNPKRQVPILIDGDVELFDSTQIFEYLEDAHPAPPLWPREPAARAAARQLEMKSDEVYFPHVIRLMGLQDRPDDPAAAAARDGASRYYVEMEACLADRKWLAGDYTFADIAFYMAALFGERMGAVLGPETPKLLAWRERMTLRPAVMPVVSAMAGYLSSQRRPVPGWLAAVVR